jgi:thiamine-phosphate pyrophosphorylase
MRRRTVLRTDRGGIGVIRYYITDRSQLADPGALAACIARNLASGVEMIQIRERDLSGHALHALVEQVLRLPNPHGARILVNDRADIALATGAAGVHLRGNAAAPSRIRAIAPEGFLIGVSCHSVEDVRRAAGEGADFAVLAPVYATPGKGPALGLEPLAAVVRSVRIPVLALGGVTSGRIKECLDAGAAGVAGISLFQGDGSTRQTSNVLASPEPGTHGR